MLNKQNLPALLLLVAFVSLVPMSLDRQNSQGSIEGVSRPISESKFRHEEGLIVEGVRYDGYEKYAYLTEAFKRGQVDINKPPRFPQYKSGYIKEELEEARRNAAAYRTKSTATFIERGPTNIPGRTRAIVIDAADPTENTWYVGAVGGGIWKTTNAGENWLELTSTLPNLAISSLAQSAANPSVLYAGTGERMFTIVSGGNGNGVVKSVDSGESWEYLTSTSGPEFVNIGRVIVNPEDENEVLVTSTANKYFRTELTSSYIFRSSDGGESWEEVYQSEYIIPQIIADPKNWLIQYASLYNGSVIKSTDGGRTWSAPVDVSKNVLNSETGTFNLLESPEIGRIELAIAPQNTNIIYASLDTGDSNLYISFDGGASWSEGYEFDPDRIITWLEDQGAWDNTILVSPLNDSIVYLGGVAMESFKMSSIVDSVQANTIDAELINTEEIIEIFNLFADEGTDILLDEYVSVEIRYGLSQKAHRFTVPEGSTSGVPAEDYTYEGLVDVPFQVWDVDNDQQLMVSFRDNNANGIYDLSDDPDSSREYIFVNNIPYIDRPEDNIAKNGGYQYRNSFLLWLMTPEDVLWDETKLSSVSIRLTLEEERLTRIRGSFTQVANPYEFAGGTTVGPNDLNALHPDHHQMFSIHVSDASFQILNANDGGVWLSDNSETPGVEDGSWTFVSSGYNTTTFYGADKSPTEDRYIAGAQDQGTHVSPSGEVGSATTEYSEVIPGDGFEAIWHSTDPNRLIGSQQDNGIFRSVDGGLNFFNATTGMEDDGPFLSRLSNSIVDPELLFAIGARGVYKSTNFGASWTYSIIDDDRWSFWLAADVEVSMADPTIVWAGGAMTEDDTPGHVFLSQDGGYSFEATSNFGDVGLVTGLYSHPLERGTAFALFGVADGPKILKTTDLGQTWTDLTQFENGESQNGFPDVSTYSLLVMPHDTSMIWAGTDIGIIESLDGGVSWNLLDAPDFRSVSVWDMKVKGDQVVIATHGRGVWTATIPELLDAPEPEVVLGPVLSQLGQSTEEFSMVLNYELRDQYDEISIYLNDEIELSIPGNINVGDTTTLIPLVDIGDYIVRIEATKGDLAFRTDELSITISPFFPTLDEYANDFNEPSDDFTLNRFSIGSTPGISSGVLQTVHPYPEGDALGVQSVNLTAKLNIPIRVAEADATISFREIVIVETGEAGTTFEDEEFWDFVVVEGSTDGATWIPFADGYDSSADPDWEAAYAGGANGSDALFRNRTINMLDKFSAGDVVQIRFRLFSDPFAAAWGWAIDNLLIQTEPVISGVNDPEIESAVSIFPNPSFGNVNLTIENVLRGDINMRVIDYSGKQILNQSLYNQTGKLEQRINLSQLPFGIYIIELNNGQDIVTKKILKF